MTRTRAALLTGLLLAAGALSGPAGGSQTPGSGASVLPPALRGVPADPRPGTVLPDTGATTVWAELQTLDAGGGFGTARPEGGPGGPRSLVFRLLPYTRFTRFGAEGVPAAEFRPGDRVLLKLLSIRWKKGAPPALYALEVRDEISDQLRLRSSYRVVSQDRDNYQFTVERLDAAGAPGERLTLEYGRGTFLVLREDPVYVFRVQPGTQLWLNSAFRPDTSIRIAREVLDVASRERFQKQERLRAAARADAAGGRGYLVRNGPTGAQIRLFPGFAEWAQRLEIGEELRVVSARAPSGTAPGLRLKSRREQSGAVILETSAAAPGLRPKDPVAVVPAVERISYRRDIWPILEVNCLSCHRDGDARSGYSLSTPEKLRAGGRRGPGVVPGKSDGSLLYLTMSGDRNPRMPPDRDMIPEELARIRRWIDAGAAMEDPKPHRPASVLRSTPDDLRRRRRVPETLEE